MATSTPDAQLAQRLTQAISNRDTARDIEIGLRTAAAIAKQQADDAKAKAKELFGVDSLEALQELAQSTYTNNLTLVAEFETEVQAYVQNVKDAQTALQGESPKV